MGKRKFAEKLASPCTGLGNPTHRKTPRGNTPEKQERIPDGPPSNKTGKGVGSFGRLSQHES